jgi:hypothetical protein
VFWPGNTHIGIITKVDSEGNIAEILHSTSDKIDMYDDNGNYIKTTNPGLQRTKYPFTNDGYYSGLNKNRINYGRVKNIPN